MKEMKISTRLAILVGALTLFMVVIGVLGVRGMHRTNADLHEVYEERTVPSIQIGEIYALMLQNRLLLNRALLTPGPEAAAQSVRAIDSNLVRFDQLVSAYQSDITTPEETELARVFAEARTRYVREGLEPGVAALRAGDVEGLRTLLRDRFPALTGPLETAVRQLNAFQAQTAETLYVESTTRFDDTLVFTTLAIILGAIIAILAGWLTVRKIGSQLGAEPAEAAYVAQRVANGDLSQIIALRKGAHASLMGQLSSMQQSLAGIVSTVRIGAESVASASQEIAHGNLDLSNRTEQQAASLEETAASMEQLSSAITQNADNARQASQLAQGARETAARGGSVVADVISTMKGITESSQRVADITGVVDSIAFQTNILALNAAVEAARAGEQGKGFAVVAGEVRHLAQRSAEAAKEIKTLISDSIARVDQGNTLVVQAGQTMDDVVSAIARVTDIMGEISAASAEQSTGVAQVGLAVSQMDQVTQQNAALVEESAAAAEQLREQAGQLVRTVAAFKLGGQGTAQRTLATAEPASLLEAPMMARLAAG